MRGHLLSFVFISTPFMVAGGIGMMLSNLLRAHGRGRQSMWVLLAGTATVALLDPLVIFVFQGGLQGVAWAGAVDAWPPCCWAAGWCSDATGWCAGRPVELRPALAAIGRIAAPAALTGLATPAAVIFAASTYAGFGSSVMAGATVMDRCCNWPIRCSSCCPARSGRSWAEPGRGQLGPHPRDGPADREAGAGLRPGHGRAAGAAGPVHRGPVQGHRPRPRSGGVLLSLRQFHLR